LSEIDRQVSATDIARVARASDHAIHRSEAPVQRPAEQTMLHEPVHTSIVDDESLPWIPFTPHADKVFLKYFKLDPVRGEMVVLVRAPAGASLPRHHHSGTVMVYTIEGRWKCREHDWIAGPGSLVIEHAASCHTPEVVGTEGQVLALTIVNGDIAFLGENDEVLTVENWKTALQRYVDYCQRAGIAPRDLTAFV
jgi:quercetin dioxygenase-like cupin family protein